MSVKLKIKVDEDVLQRSMFCGTEAMKGDIPHNCAIAIALKDVFPKACVGYNYASLGTFGVDLPKEANKFIKDFDKLRDTPVARIDLPEFEFEIEIPDEEIAKIGDMEEVKRIIATSKTLELV